MRQKLRAAIIHGTGGSPARNWFLWLKAELVDRDIDVIVPHFPTPAGQSLNAWTDVFSREVGAISEDLILFGHSIGVAFVLSLLNNSTQSARATFLVAGFLGKLNSATFDPLNVSFFEPTLDWKKIRARAGSMHLYNGDDDPYVPLEKGVEIARNLGVELNVIEKGGHLNAEFGYTSFPKLIHDLESSIRIEKPAVGY